MWIRDDTELENSCFLFNLQSVAVSVYFEMFSLVNYDPVFSNNKKQSSSGDNAGRDIDYNTRFLKRVLSAHRVSSNICPFHVCLLSNKPVVLSGWLKILFSILILHHYLTWLLTGNFVVSDTTSINYRTRGIENMILLLKECWLLDEVYCQKAILKRTSSKNGFPTTNLWPTKAGNMKFREVFPRLLLSQSLLQENMKIQNDL